MAARSRTSATAVSTRSSPNSAPISRSAASSTSVSTSLAPLACRRRATSAPTPRPPPVIKTTLPFTELMRYSLSWVGLQLDAQQCVDRGRHRLRRLAVVPAVVERIGSPTIKRGKRFRCIEIVGEIPAHSGDHIGCIGPDRQRRRRLASAAAGAPHRPAPHHSTTGQRGNDRPAARAGSPPVRRRRRATGRPAPGFPGSCSSCGRPSRSFPRARSAGRIAAPP